MCSTAATIWPIAPEGLLDPEMPLARRDAPLDGDTCGNAGGLDQDIFGISFTT